MPTVKSVAVSTARDLPEHRKHVMDACQRCTCDFVWMETLPASDDDAVKVSLALVDKADIYLGIFAHRYGYVPAGSEISITEMEYDRAKKRGIPWLIFFMHDEHPLTKAMVETGAGAAKVAEPDDARHPLFHADALNALAQIERDADHKAEAIAAATQAYQKAWCDGPPFAYHGGLEAAKKHWRELGAPFPDMPAFDESKYPPMPAVEIKPRDEYYVGEEPI